MARIVTRIILGVAMLAAAWQSFSMSLRRLEEARGPIPAQFRSIQDLDIDFFDRPDPRDIPTTPEQLAKYREAFWLQRFSLATVLPGIALILLGVLPTIVPPTFRLLVWHFIPDFMRRHGNDAAIEMVPESAAPEDVRPPGPEAVPLV
ncbi:hypothetical protein [Paludisphaera mucosa]|uniref:Uncharacterized protein n=1 Tax=Paludisphaera mucosa TaxID=3030827 RepID=A0ABT6FFU0_9BACT|nr:hypothetical protein [Paludisphaera mucosa]MDG3006442.1 hypothetical protein [Paludisphaera mucosa]